MESIFFDCVISGELPKMGSCLLSSTMCRFDARGWFRKEAYNTYTLGFPFPNLN